MFENQRERFEKFEAENGGNGVRINNYLYYPSGARAECSMTGLGAWLNPPNDPYERQKIVVRYYERRLELAVQEFENLKENLLARAKAAQRQQGVPPDKESSISELKTLKEKVMLRKKDLDAAQENLEAAVPDGVKQGQKMDEHIQSLTKSFITDISKIEV